MDDAGRDKHIIQVGNIALAGFNGFQKKLAVQVARIIVNVQRANARSNVHNSAETGPAQSLFERVDTEAEIEVEHVRAKFDQQAAIAIGAASDTGTVPQDWLVAHRITR